MATISLRLLISARVITVAMRTERGRSSVMISGSCSMKKVSMVAQESPASWKLSTFSMKSKEHVYAHKSDY
jgi:hypothetical protein